MDGETTNSLRQQSWASAPFRRWKMFERLEARPTASTLIAAHLVLWGIVGGSGEHQASTRVSRALADDFGSWWPWFMVAVGVLLLVGVALYDRTNKIYRMGLRLSILCWGAIAASMLAEGWFWSFATLTVLMMTAWSVLLKALDIRDQRRARKIAA